VTINQSWQNGCISQVDDLDILGRKLHHFRGPANLFDPLSLDQNPRTF
jgi:hypothetical protein